MKAFALVVAVAWAVVVCAVVGCTKSASTPPESAPSPPAADAEGGYEQLASRCIAQPAGQAAIATALLSAQNQLLAKRAHDIDMDRYCPCFYEGFADEVGTDTALAYFNLKLTGSELIETAQQADKSRLRCAMTSLGPDTGGGVDAFGALFALPFDSAAGLGDVVMGASLDQVEDALGQTNAVHHAKGYDSYSFGPNSIELVVDVAPPGDDAVVVGVKVDYTYRGKTIRGLVPGTSTKPEVLRLHGAPVFESTTLLIYANGAKFGFDEHGILRTLAVVSKTVDPLMAAFGDKK